MASEHEPTLEELLAALEHRHRGQDLNCELAKLIKELKL